MNLDAVVTKGRLPWSPNTDVHDLDVWYEYEHPRVGTFRTAECTVLFTAVGGFESRTSVWAYACLQPEEARNLGEPSFDSLSDMREFIEKEFAGRTLVLALANDLTVSRWAVADETGALYDVATTFLERIMAETRNRQDAGTKFRAKLAQVDIATDELIEA